MEFVRKIMATVAMPVDEALPGTGSGVVLLMIVTMTKQTDMSRAEIQRVGLRPQSSLKKRR
jgi:hypothetical protein